MCDRELVNSAELSASTVAFLLDGGRPEDPLQMIDGVQYGISCIIDDCVCRQLRAKCPIFGIVFA
jgi:hypothetical protein